eukprot:TRINITY_DN5867_c0_g1_i1.p2 TRINITY_DN5867_c0_g1~~TRINITY_DN5867_c0_g1_i1.p2  ORF type:complete len:151 (-),score=12.23 TRINITY_DN5867_c0_g1_i1:245-697(-)
MARAAEGLPVPCIERWIEMTGRKRYLAQRRAFEYKWGTAVQCVPVPDVLSEAIRGLAVGAFDHAHSRDLLLAIGTRKWCIRSAHGRARGGQGPPRPPVTLPDDALNSARAAAPSSGDTDSEVSVTPIRHKLPGSADQCSHLPCYAWTVEI